MTQLFQSLLRVSCLLLLAKTDVMVSAHKVVPTKLGTSRSLFWHPFKKKGVLRTNPKKAIGIPLAISAIMYAATHIEREKHRKKDHKVAMATLARYQSSPKMQSLESHTINPSQP